MGNDREETLNRLRHWYKQTQNPLYAWEAIARCLTADAPPSIPDWCIPYLRDAATNLTSLASGRDFGEGTEKRILSNRAMRLVPRALALSRQGKRNAFAGLLEDTRDARAALDSETSYPNASRAVRKFGLTKTEKQRSVTRDRAQRIIARGKKLLHSR